jgi:hypothetical protein
MRGDIGMQGAAAKRTAALEGAESGFGAGGGGEFMQRAGDIDYATQVGMGKGAGELALTAPRVGADMLSRTFAPQQQEYGRTEQSRQFGADFGAGERRFGAELGERGRQLGVEVGLKQQGMANEMARYNADLAERQRQFDDMYDLQRDEFAAEYGGYGPDPYYGGGGALAMG